MKPASEYSLVYCALYGVFYVSLRLLCAMSEFTSHSLSFRMILQENQNFNSTLHITYVLNWNINGNIMLHVQCRFNDMRIVSKGFSRFSLGRHSCFPHVPVYPNCTLIPVCYTLYPIIPVDEAQLYRSEPALIKP